jgi:glucose-6-phosphate 1-epimerase
MSDVTKLLKTTLSPGSRVVKGRGELLILDVQRAEATAQVYFNGAHLAAWQPKHALAPVLWVSRESQFEAGKPIRGGVPVCFPWFAAHATEKTAPGHGFARINDWTLTSDHDGPDGRVLVFELKSDAPLSPVWPHAFHLRYGLAVGSALTMSLEVRNPGPAPITFEEALHTYYAVQDVREVRVTGLEGVEYLDKVTGFSRKRESQEPLRIAGETDRIYLATKSACSIHDPGKRRRIVVSKTGSETTVVWNPWVDRARAIPDLGDLEWPEFLCIETCNVNAHAVTLGPGASHTMTARVEVINEA